ncbi:allantoinase AllB [Allonocardiopsis opalescens]|uniref:allantoinase n=1 Tax=Allonocardiopsis opalescens TaxID=1144618 RepID=A0A2T0QCH7_9ACTN|nr:allantoinase AllB [Allonocardiopsis opalescens]PRY01654.1 allantoinase [Allonocardiopsis opalescens]
MTVFDLVVRSRRVVLPDGERAAAVGVTGGRIAAVGGYGERMAARVEHDLGGLVLLPGLVDAHVHVNEPGRTEWEGFDSATRAAGAGGVTTIVDMPLNSVPPTVTVAALDAKRAAARGRCHVDTALWGGAVPAHLPELPELLAAGVPGAKCFLLDSGVPEFPPLDDDGLRTALRAAERAGAVILVHAEDAGLIGDCSGPGFAGFLASRPGAAEARAVERVIAACAATGGRAHIVHLSSAEALPALARARAAGVPVTAETCPHYLYFSAEEVPDGATPFKCCPPIRSAADRDALWAALADGTIDQVVSDHSPCTPELKRLDTGDFGAAWGGIAGVQLALPVVWTAARERGLPLSRLAAWMAAAPARLAGLAAKGAIRVGADADLVAFDPDAEFTVDPARLHHRHPVTPYAGRRLAGLVRTTWLRGAVVDGRTPRGRLIEEVRRR